METTDEAVPSVYMILQPAHKDTGELLIGDPEGSRPHSPDDMDVMPFRMQLGHKHHVLFPSRLSGR